MYTHTHTHTHTQCSEDVVWWNTMNIYPYYTWCACSAIWWTPFYVDKWRQGSLNILHLHLHLCSQMSAHFMRSILLCELEKQSRLPCAHLTLQHRLPPASTLNSIMSSLVIYFTSPHLILFCRFINIYFDSSHGVGYCTKILFDHCTK